MPKTIYKIRAEIPARVAEESGLLSKAREIGLNLKFDDAGNVEGEWGASLLSLGTFLKMLQEAGVQKPLIQRRVIGLVIATEASKIKALIGILRESRVLKAEDMLSAKDVLSGEDVFRCYVSCEDAEQLVKRIRESGIGKLIATEAYEPVD